MSAKSFGKLPYVNLQISEDELLPDGRLRSRTKSYVRRGNRMATSLENTWNEHADKYLIAVPRGVAELSVHAKEPLDLTEVFSRTAPVTLEVGCGIGDQIVSAAAENPQNNYLGIEVWRPGVAKIISRAVNAEVQNLRLIEADAVQVLEQLINQASLHEVWTFFPDPWRKSRHHKRRLVQSPFAQLVASRLRPGGYWRLATDWDDYAWQMRDVVESCPLLQNPHLGQRPDEADPAGARGGFAPRYSGRVLTRFEQRGQKAGRNIHDILGQRNMVPC